MNFCRNILNSSNAAKTLWKNLSPSSNFGAQTISCDLSHVDFEKSEVILKFKRKSTDTKTIEIRLNEGENEVCVGNSSYFFWRKYTLSKTGVAVASGGYTSTYPEIKTDNSCATPIELKIRGGGRKFSLFNRVYAPFEHLRKKVSLMGFCRNILPNGSGKNPFPGYELKVGELCSLPALTTNDSSARILNIPAGCIPVCIRMDATFKANSGKGETPDLVLDVRDNNGNILFRACRNGAGQIYNNGTAYLCPLGAYNGDLERAKTCTQIHVRAHNDSAWLYSDYQYGKVAVTMWLEKVGA